MRDVLKVLSKLPPVCATWAGQGYLIKRGVIGMTDYPLSSENDVAEFNQSHGVTPAQKRAMEVGCVAGWDAEGADLTCEGDSVFVYTAPFTLMMSVMAGTEDQAAEVAQTVADEVADRLSDISNWPAQVLTITRDGKELDLIE